MSHTAKFHTETFDLYRAAAERITAQPEGPSPRLPDHPAAKKEEGEYLASRELAEAVNLAICVGQPLLVTGDPGCGKTRLAESVASQLGLGEAPEHRPLSFHTRSTSRAQDLLYRYDAVRRFQDIQGSEIDKERAQNPEHYIMYGPLGRAIRESRAGCRHVVLIDEVDKAPRDFPNDLLNELDNMEIHVPELGEKHPDRRVKAISNWPVVIITSNKERQLPLPFLRRCVFFHISFPDRDDLIQIIGQRLGSLAIEADLIEAAVDRFREIHELAKSTQMTKQPSTGELLVWLSALHARGVEAATVRAQRLEKLPLLAALLKDRHDFEALEPRAI